MNDFYFMALDVLNLPLKLLYATLFPAFARSFQHISQSIDFVRVLGEAVVRAQHLPSDTFPLVQMLVLQINSFDTHQMRQLEDAAVGSDADCVAIQASDEAYKKHLGRKVSSAWKSVIPVLDQIDVRVRNCHAIHLRGKMHWIAYQHQFPAWVLKTDHNHHLRQHDFIGVQPWSCSGRLARFTAPE